MLGEKGFVYLVGAGPGDPGLLTVKGKYLLETCDVVVYDRLAGEELLSCVGESCRKIYVGKQPGGHTRTQREINEILVHEAKRGQTVVRLKGGDPFVFGRGGEEILALEEAGIGYQTVPGVTSAIAVPEVCGIPVTHRGVSRAFHVITAHTADSDSGLGESLESLAALSGTLVFLMGMEKLERIASGLIQAGKNAQTPAAVIQEGTAAGEKIVRGPLKEIAERVQKAKLHAPAVIVVGPAAALNFMRREERPDAAEEKSCTVGICGSRHFVGKLKEELCRGGDPDLQISDLGFFEERELTHTPEFEAFWRQLDRFRFLAFTSVHGVDAFFAACLERRLDHRRLSGVKFAVIGPATGERLEQYGFQADLCPERFYGEDLGQALVRALREAPGNGIKTGTGEKEPAASLALLCSAGGGDSAANVLTACGVSFLRVPVYDMTVKAKELETAVRTAKQADTLVFGSSFAAACFLRALAENKEWETLQKPIYCIGEVTARTARSVLKPLGPGADPRVPEACTTEALAEQIKKEMSGGGADKGGNERRRNR